MPVPTESPRTFTVVLNLSSSQSIEKMKHPQPPSRPVREDWQEAQETLIALPPAKLVTYKAAFSKGQESFALPPVE